MKKVLKYIMPMVMIFSSTICYALECRSYIPINTSVPVSAGSTPATSGYAMVAICVANQPWYQDVTISDITIGGVNVKLSATRKGCEGLSDAWGFQFNYNGIMPISSPTSYNVGVTVNGTTTAVKKDLELVLWYNPSTSWYDGDFSTKQVFPFNYTDGNDEITFQDVILDTESSSAPTEVDIKVVQSGNYDSKGKIKYSINPSDDTSIDVKFNNGSDTYQSTNFKDVPKVRISTNNAEPGIHKRSIEAVMTCP